jgi:hypothetical protein
MSAVPVAEEIEALLREQTGIRSSLDADASLQDLGLFADDLSEFMATFGERFGVDLSTFRWYFHTGEEGISPGGLFFTPPQDRVPKIPITLRLLREAAELRRWPVDYPNHSLPARRWDIVINQCLVGAFVLWLLWWLAGRLF